MTIVPTPSGVNSSSTRACSTRPSTRCTRPTPAGRPHGALELRDHAAGHDIGLREQLEALVSGQLAQQVAGRSDQPGHVVDEDELLGAELDRELARDHVGVHVVGLPGRLVDRDARDHRHEPLGRERAEHVGVHVHDLAHEPEVGAVCLRASSSPPSTPDSPTAGTPPVTSDATTRC